MGFATYSLADVVTTINHPDVGKCVLSDEGGGRITLSYSGDLSSATTTATGYVVVNKLVAKNGSCGLEVPKNSGADNFLRKWIKYLKSAPTKRFALASLVLNDTAGGNVITLIGVTPQKEPDDTYDAQASNVQYNLLYAERKD